MIAKPNTCNSYFNKWNNEFKQYATSIIVVIVLFISVFLFNLFYLFTLHFSHFKKLFRTWKLLCFILKSSYTSSFIIKLCNLFHFIQRFFFTSLILFCKHRLSSFLVWEGLALKEDNILLEFISLLLLAKPLLFYLHLLNLTVWI